MIKDLSGFFNQSFVSINQLQSQAVLEIMDLADHFKKCLEEGIPIAPLRGKGVSILFFEDSTRTFASFLSAAHWLGANVTPFPGMHAYSSAASTKGENLADTIRTIPQSTGASLIVLRHPDDRSSEVAASFSPVPVINAGSGQREHPTQALLDLYSIRAFLGEIRNGIKVALVGDLRFGRTVKSLAKLLDLLNLNCSLSLVSPDELQLPAELCKDLGKCKLSHHRTIDEIIDDVDVLYMTRIQKERMSDSKLYSRVKGRMILTEELARRMKAETIILHPFPRVDEIEEAVDSLPQARYFEQMRSGLYIRMALMAAILLKDAPSTLAFRRVPALVK